ncbi:MAG TPA: ACT domain-containing protein [Elusimicrobiota bacterium]|nr:ACT domain-containing protein [Elusimicrobiota bacterium]
MPEVINKKVLVIEYPRHNETITSKDYTFRIVAIPGVRKVEMSIDEAGWQPCRQSGDSWWYDWSGFGSGDHEIVARVQFSDGHYHTTERRFFTVENHRFAGEVRRFSPARRHETGSRYERMDGMARKYVVVAPNQPGVLRQLTQLLSQEGVNIDSLLLDTHGDVASFRFLLERENGLRRTLESEGFHVVEDKVFRLSLHNRPGELDQLTRRLTEHGVAVKYLYGTSHGQTTNVVFSVDRPEHAADIVKEFDQRFVAA